MNSDIKYFADTNGVVKVVTIIVDGKQHLVPYKSLFYADDECLFETREDALYSNFLKKVIHGKKIENYKSSKYYKMYRKRLLVDHPELLI